MDAIQQKVISIVTSLSARFPSMSFSYGYDAIARQYVVDVNPETLYASEEYMIAEADVYYDWDAVYPDNDLMFVSNNAYHLVTNPVFSITGQVDIRADETTASVGAPLLVFIDEPQPTGSANDLYGQLTASPFIVTFGPGAVQQTITINQSELGTLEPGEYNYAMAA